MREPVFKALVGSHNYNLNELGSDKDYKVYVLPTFEDLYNGKMYALSELGEKEDVDTHDIRKLPSLFWKANLNYLEVLYSQDSTILSHNMDIRERLGLMLRGKRKELVTMNLPYLYSACIGMHFQKIKAIELDKWTSGTEHLFGKYGYDTKQAMHAYRVLDFLERFYLTNFDDFEKAIRYEGKAREGILKFKYGAYSKREFLELAEQKVEEARALEGNYQLPTNDTLHKELQDCIMEIVREGLKCN